VLHRQEQARVKPLENLRRINPIATIIEAASHLFVNDLSAISGKRIFVIIDSPILTLGEMVYSAGDGCCSPMPEEN